MDNRNRGLLSPTAPAADFDTHLLSAPQLNVRSDAPEKNCSFLAPASGCPSDECPLFSLAGILCKTLREAACDFDVVEADCKWTGLYHGSTSFVTFTVRIYSAIMKSCGTRRHVIVVQRLSGESVPFRRLYGVLKAAVCSEKCSPVQRVSLRGKSLSTCDGSSWRGGGSLKKEIDALCKVMQNNSYLDQIIFALRRLSKLVKSDGAARSIIAGNSSLMKNLLTIFELTTDQYWCVFLSSQYSEHCHLMARLQHQTAAVISGLSEDSSCISSLVQSGFLVTCLEYQYLVTRYEAVCQNRHKIHFLYRQSQREITKCLRNIRSCPTVNVVEMFYEEGHPNSTLDE